MGRPKAPCGTDAAYRRHLRNDEPVDEACRDAHAATRRASRRSPAAAPSAPKTTEPPDDDDVADDGETDDLELIVKTLRKAFVKIAADDPTKLAPIAREFRTAVESTRGPVEPPKELTLAEQLAQARAARAARTQSQDAAS
ncbi:hypothetical protein [Microbacterium aurantiacum]|uniref:Terminase small subunit n=1 Tax=Microbacterium aurantiacum TaxID=162393 RepID=A0ABT8FS17_9MICO|nr:hypothetical protein [Microbacterium aurantiacum]MDN4463902.1 hypothetical protein [Microbacterium aurantiacum]